jgi:hypothetical protein
MTPISTGERSTSPPGRRRAIEIDEQPRGLRVCDNCRRYVFSLLRDEYDWHRTGYVREGCNKLLTFRHLS